MLVDEPAGRRESPGSSTRGSLWYYRRPHRRRSRPLEARASNPSARTGTLSVAVLAGVLGRSFRGSLLRHDPPHGLLAFPGSALLILAGTPLLIVVGHHGLAFTRTAEVRPASV